MNANSLKFIRTAGLVAGALVALSSLPLLGADKAADAFPNFDSYIKITGQAASVTGDSAAFAARARQPENGSYGIEDFYYSKETGKDVTMTINGRGKYVPSAAGITQQQAFTDMVVFQRQKGQNVILYPADAANGKIVKA